MAQSEKEVEVTENRVAQPPATQATRPDPALQRLERLVGTWEITGRTLDATEDNLSGRVIIEWLPGRFFLQQRGEMEFGEFKVQSLEIVGYDQATDTFPSYVYSNLSGEPVRYHWNVQGDTVTHWDATSKYTGTFSDGGKILAGGWRPNPGEEGPGNVAYDATMTRVG